MAYRSRTSDFVRLREDHTYRRGGKFSDKRTLLGDVEMKEHIVYLPPDWIARVSDIQYEITNIKSRLHDLTELHKSHLLSAFSDRDDEEHAIEVLTSEITKMFHKAQKLTKAIGKGDAKLNTNEEKQLKTNIQAELARELQDLTISFRQAQKKYLTALRARQVKIGQYSYLSELEPQNIDTGFSQEQLQHLSDIDDRISQREKDIIQIAKSIQELAEIFSDLSKLVIDQGTILDRIDYNIEQTSVHVEAGREELTKASTAQKSSRTKLCILLLCILILVMAAVIVIKVLI